MKPLLLTLAFAVAFQTSGLAQSPPPAPAAGSVQFTAHDVAALLKATMNAVNSPNITINMALRKPSDMPPYDPTFHFVGLDAKGTATIWAVEPVEKTQASANALRAATELACMATGFAGPLWKSIYEQVAAADAGQPAGSPNPYRNRLALTARIQAIIDSYAPSPAPSASTRSPRAFARRFVPT